MTIATKLDREKLYDKLGKADSLTITKETFNNLLSFDNNNWKAHGVVFKECSFTGPISFNYVDLWCGIRFENCSFDQSIDFNYCEASQTDPKFNTPNCASIEFVRCVLESKLTIRNCKLHYGIWAGKQTVFETIHLLDIQAGKIQFDGLTVNGRMEISKIVNLSGFFFENCTFNSSLIFYECTSKHIISNCNFEELQFSACSFQGLFIDNSKFLTTLNFWGCHATVIRFEELIFEKTVSMDTFESETEQYGLIRELKIIDCDFKGGFTFTGLPEKNDSADIQSLCLSCSEKMKGTINFEHCKISSTHITGANNTAIVIAFALVQQIDCTQLVNKGTINLISVKPISTLTSSINIDKSLLGKMMFSDIDFNQYQSITITHSNVIEIMTNSINWFDGKKLKTDIPALRKDVYRQLKFAMEKQGDHYNALRFRRDEQSAYRLELRSYPTTFTNLGDKLIMWISRSNDYGYNWLKPLSLIFTTVLLFYIVLAISVAPGLYWFPDLKNTPVTVNYLIQNANNLFLLFNPAHKTSELFDTVASARHSFGFYGADFLERLVVSYFLFQTITAFRKYIK